MTSKNKIKENDMVLICHESGKSFLRPVEYRTFTTEWGGYFLKELIGLDYGAIVKTTKDVKLKILKPDTNDLLVKSLKRLPQIINKKDAGLIITSLGINKESRVLESGTGSAYLTTYLAGIAKEVVTFEINLRHYKNAIENIEKMGLDNVKIINDDIINSKEMDFDCVVLDLPDPERVIPTLATKIKIGGRIAVYVPCIEQIIASDKSLKASGFEGISIKECILRSWKTDDCTRPNTKMLGHTGFLVFARYMGKWD
ncbi:MAG: methyltransferase domain-containing protein [DPANN group archaeon]|nr:methyltransferase domain-containing protein [DPANN group archaeon]